MGDELAKNLIFSIADERYGVPISKVREVIRHEKITPVHDASVFLKGVINLRGKIIPVIDMRIKFGMKPLEYTDRTVFIIVEVCGIKEVFSFGMAVDAVHEVVDLQPESIESLPDVGFRLKGNYLLGIAKTVNSMVMLLDIDKILQSQDLSDLINRESL